MGRAMEQGVCHVYHIEGMTCSGCAARIEQILSDLPGIQSARTSFASETLTISFNPNQVDEVQIRDALEKSGYRLRPPNEEKAPDPVKLTGLQFTAVAVIIAAIYIMIKKVGGFNILPAVDASMSLALLFTVGLLTSLHCVAMCGGIVVSQCMVASGGGGRAGWQRGLLYNSGRVISYTLVGGLAGALGSAVSLTGWARGSVAVASGLLMMVMGINLLGWFPSLARMMPRMPRFLPCLRRKPGTSPLLVGLLNGLMPCGPLQTMQLYALGTGSPAAGAAAMFFFSLGTVPLLLGLGTAVSLLGKRLTQQMLKVSAILVIALGLVMIDRGLLLSGFSLR